MILRYLIYDNRKHAFYRLRQIGTAAGNLGGLAAVIFVYRFCLRGEKRGRSGEENGQVCRVMIEYGYRKQLWGTASRSGHSPWAEQKNCIVISPKAMYNNTYKIGSYHSYRVPKRGVRYAHN